MTGKPASARRVVLRRYPVGELQPSDFAIEPCETPKLAEAEFLVRNRFVSVDPMIRLMVDAAPLGGALPPLPLGSTIPGPAVGEVIQSRNSAFAIGDVVEGRFGWQDYAVSNGVGVHRVNTALGACENALGIGGLPGFTAYVGVHTAQVQAGQTVLVSGAAGGVGSVVGPLVNARAGRAVGIVGGEAKRRRLLEQGGYVAAVDRTAPDFTDQLAAALPDGAHVYFDNVGGPMLATVMPLMARGGLVLISGLMAQYQGGGSGAADHLPVVLQNVMGRGVRIQSFSQWGQQALRPAFEQEIVRLFETGTLRSEMTIEEGIERLPHALWGLFNKSVVGKVVVRVGDVG